MEALNAFLHLEFGESEIRETVRCADSNTFEIVHEYLSDFSLMVLTYEESLSEVRSILLEHFDENIFNDTIADSKFKDHIDVDSWVRDAIVTEEANTGSFEGLLSSGERSQYHEQIVRGKSFFVYEIQ